MRKIFFIILALTLFSCASTTNLGSQDYLKIRFDEFIESPCDFEGKKVAIKCYYETTMRFCFSSENTFNEADTSRYSLTDIRWKQQIFLKFEKKSILCTCPANTKGIFWIYGVGDNKKFCKKAIVYGGYLKVHNIKLVQED